MRFVDDDYYSDHCCPSHELIRGVTVSLNRTI